MIEAEARDILAKLAGPKPPELKFVDSMRYRRQTIRIQAKYDSRRDRITMTRPMLADFVNEAELAFMLGHELGHRKHKHDIWDQSFRGGDTEEEADAHGIALMKQHGFNVRRVPWWFDRRINALTGRGKAKMALRRNAVLKLFEGIRA